MRGGKVSGSQIVRHKEHVRVVPGNTTDEFRVTVIQPGLKESFPWLSGIARNYDRYRFRKLTYKYVPVVGTSTNGRVAIGFDPDVLDPIPVLSSDFYSLPKYKSGPVWEEHTLEIPMRNATLFTRIATVADSDQKTYDFGSLFIYINASDTALKGDLFVEYEIELLDPQQGECVSAFVQADRDTLDASNPLGDSIEIFGNGPITYDDTDEFSVIQAGVYFVTVRVAGTGLTDVDVTNSGITKNNDELVINSDGTRALYSFVMLVPRSEKLQVTTTGTTVTNVSFFIGEVDRALAGVEIF